MRLPQEICVGDTAETHHRESHKTSVRKRSVFRFLFIFRTGDRSPYGKHCRRKKGSPPSLKDCPDERLDRRRIPPRRRSSLRYAPPGQRSFRTVLSSVDRKFSLFPSCFSCLQHSIFFSFCQGVFSYKTKHPDEEFPRKAEITDPACFFCRQDLLIPEDRRPHPAFRGRRHPTCL